MDILDLPDATVWDAWLDAAALAADADAGTAFERLGRSERYTVILPVLQARTAPVRARTVARQLALLPRHGVGSPP